MQMYIHGKVHVYIHWHVYINVNIADFWELYNSWHSVWWTAMFWQNSLCCRHGRVHVSFQPLASPPHPDTLEYVLQAPDWMGFILSCICNPPKRISTLPHCWEFAASRDGCVDYVWISGMRTGGGGGSPRFGDVDIIHQMFVLKRKFVYLPVRAFFLQELYLFVYHQHLCSFWGHPVC